MRSHKINRKTIKSLKQNEKEILFNWALVAMSMSAMFVACSKNDKNEPTSSGSNGCNCTIRDEWGTENEYFSTGDMAQMGATSCSELTGVLRGMYVSHDQSASISCN